MLCPPSQPGREGTGRTSTRPSLLAGRSVTGDQGWARRCSPSRLPPAQGRAGGTHSRAAGKCTPHQGTNYEFSRLPSLHYLPVQGLVVKARTVTAGDFSASRSPAVRGNGSARRPQLPSLPPSSLRRHWQECGDDGWSSVRRSPDPTSSKGL